MTVWVWGEPSCHRGLGGWGSPHSTPRGADTTYWGAGQISSLTKEPSDPQSDGCPVKLSRVSTTCCLPGVTVFSRCQTHLSEPGHLLALRSVGANWVTVRTHCSQTHTSGRWCRADLSVPRWQCGDRGWSEVCRKADISGPSAKAGDVAER